MEERNERDQQAETTNRRRNLPSWRTGSQLTTYKRKQSNESIYVIDSVARDYKLQPCRLTLFLNGEDLIKLVSSRCFLIVEVAPAMGPSSKDLLLKRAADNSFFVGIFLYSMAVQFVAMETTLRNPLSYQIYDGLIGYSILDDRSS